MPSRDRVSERIDLIALEQRTQAIGRELFAASKREHAHLSVLNRWTAEILSWCLSDPSLKATILRFIDVLPSLRSPREIARHVREYFPADIRLPAALRLGSRLAEHPGLVTSGALSALITQLVEKVARQFIAEHHPEGVARVIQELALRRATCSLDVLGEQVLTESEADRYVSQCAVLLDGCAAAYAKLPVSSSIVRCAPLVNLSVKPSALTPRFDPISPSASIGQAAQRLLPLLQRAAEHSAVINLDMEQYELRDLTVALAKHLLIHPEIGPCPVPPRAKTGAGAGLGLVIQAYLRDAEEMTEELLSWLATHECRLTIRLVKGAYWDSEVAQALQRHWPVPVYQQKTETDLTFERLTRRLLSASPLVTTAVASHNVRSIAHAMAAAEALGLSKHQLEFQLLYGMGDAIHAAIVSLGYPVRIYTPIGELIPGMAYLVRRILENTSNDSFLRQDFFQERSADQLLRGPSVTLRTDTAPRQPAAREGWTGEPMTDFSKEATRAAMKEALDAVRGQLGRTYPLLLDREVVPVGETIEIRNPAAPDALVGLVFRARRAEAARAVEVAGSAQLAWANTPVRERTACLRRAAALMRQQRETLAAWEIFEVGKTWREADMDVVEAIEYLEYYGWCMEALTDGKPLLQVPGEHNAYRYIPRGVAAVIAPWNFPVAILTGMASAALVTGNAVILKPAEQSSVVASHVAGILRGAGIPAGVIQYVPGLGEEVGAALVRHLGVHTILFTGSKAVGLSIIGSCASIAPGQRFIKHVVAEMGGKNAILIDADADLDDAVAGTLRSAFGYGGQKCSAASRVIVHEAVCDRFLSRLIDAIDRLVIGDPADPATDVGPLIDEAAKRRLLEAIARASEIGTLAYRYPASRLPQQGHFVGPAVATGIPPTDPLAREELFGPFLCVFRVDTFEQALALANSTDYALTGGVYSRSPSRLELAVRSFDVGNLYLNRPITGALVGRQPFGGHRLSGLGTKSGGPDYLLQFMIPKTVCTNTARHGIPLD